MKRKSLIALWSTAVFGFITSGLLASIAWFENGRNNLDVDIAGSVVKEYFHCGDGSSSNPYVITRPIHYYHLVELFQRVTSLSDTSKFGTDYLYFQVGYDIDNDGDLEVYNYDDQGIYQGTGDTPSYSNTLNMAYYSATNALMPIGTNEVPFIGSFDGKADEGIVIANLNIHCAETVDIEGESEDRVASDIGIFGYVADKDTGNTPTVIKNAKFDGITIDLTNVSSVVKPSTTGTTHEDAHNGVPCVGWVAGHVHTYVNYSSTGPTNATPLYNVYVSNASVVAGAGVRSDYGYIGKVDSIDSSAPALVGDEVSTLVAGGGQGDNFGEGGSISADDYLKWLYNGPRDNNASLQQGSSTAENHITKTSQYEAHYTVSPPLTNLNKDFLFAARFSDSKIFYFYDARGNFYNGSNHPFSWTTHNSGTKPTGATNYTITFDSQLTIGDTTGTIFYLNHYNSTEAACRVYKTISGSGKTNQVEASQYTLFSNSVYRLKDNYNGSSGNTHKSYIPLKFSNAEKSGVSDDNTGYIVGASLKTTSGANAANGSPKFGMYGANYISNSLGSASYTASNIVQQGIGNSTFNDSQLEVLTYSTADNSWVGIKDSHNSAYYGTSTSPKNGNISSQVSLLRTPEQLGLKKYEPYASDPSIAETPGKPLTRNAFRNLMTYTENDVTKPYYHITGIHFDTVNANGTKYGVVANSANYKVTIPRAHLNGVPVASSSSYELLTGAINFFFPSKGYVNFFAGTYNSDASVLCNFFSLYTVKRSPSNPNQISSIHEIVGVYKKKNGSAADPYIYKVYNVDSDGDATGSAYYLDTNLTDNDLDLVYDVDKSLRCGTVHTAPVNNALYYFEIPINPGEYAMGAVSNSTNTGAYMLYLDIGANADLSVNQIAGVKDVPLFTQIDFQTDSFVTNSCFNVAFIIPAGATKSNFLLTISFNVVEIDGNDYRCYELEIVNTTGHDLNISCLLMDDDDNPNNDYYGLYAITYNNGTRTEYNSSDTFIGESGATAMTSAYSQNNG